MSNCWIKLMKYRAALMKRNHFERMLMYWENRGETRLNNWMKKFWLSKRSRLIWKIKLIRLSIIKRSGRVKDKKLRKNLQKPSKFTNEFSSRKVPSWRKNWSIQNWTQPINKSVYRRTGWRNKYSCKNNVSRKEKDISKHWKRNLCKTRVGKKITSLRYYQQKQ